MVCTYIIWTRTKKTEYSNDRTLKVIFGETVQDAITLGISNTRYNKTIPVDEIENSINRFNLRLEKLKAQSSYPGKSRTGHGTKRLLEPLQAVQSKINNYKYTMNHKYSKLIVKEAIAKKCSSISVYGEKFFIGWPICNLLEMIKYKAEEVGLNLIKD